jgi:hypothetical protein
MSRKATMARGPAALTSGGTSATAALVRKTGAGWVESAEERLWWYNAVQCGTICGTGKVSVFTTRGMGEEVFTFLQFARQAASKHYLHALLRAAGSPESRGYPPLDLYST